MFSTKVASVRVNTLVYYMSELENSLTVLFMSSCVYVPNIFFNVFLIKERGTFSWKEDLWNRNFVLRHFNRIKEYMYARMTKTVRIKHRPDLK